MRYMITYAVGDTVLNKNPSHAGGRLVEKLSGGKWVIEWIGSQRTRETIRTHELNRHFIKSQDLTDRTITT
jgi:hypothetical protein